MENDNRVRFLAVRKLRRLPFVAELRAEGNRLRGVQVLGEPARNQKGFNRP